MKKGLILLSILLVFGFFQGCRTQRLTSDYKKIISVTPPKPDKVLGITFNSRKFKASSSSTKPRKIFDLSDKGQKALIEAYSSNTSENKEILKYIKEPIENVSVSKSTPKIIDSGLLTIKRDFQLFVENLEERKSPRSRIEYLRIEISLPPDSKVQFESFEGIQTKYSYHEFGSVSETRTRNFSLGGEIGYGITNSSSEFDTNNNQTGSSSVTIGPKASTSIGSSNSVVESVNPKERIIEQTGFMSDKQITLYFEGTPFKDLNGPITVQVTMTVKTKQLPVQYVKFSKSAASVKLERKLLLKPDETAFPNGVLGDISAEWLYRKVERNNRSTIPGKHVISRFNQKHKFHDDKELIPSASLKQTAFLFEDSSGLPVKLKLPTGKFYLLQFLTREEAIQFKLHLIEQKTNKINGVEIVDSNGTLIPIANIPNIELKQDVF